MNNSARQTARALGRITVDKSRVHFDSKNQATVDEAFRAAQPVIARGYDVLVRNQGDWMDLMCSQEARYGGAHLATISIYPTADGAFSHRVYGTYAGLFR